MAIDFLGFFRQKDETVKANADGLKVLHVGNVANLAFVNSRLLNKMGYNSHLITPDFYHFASSPEWQDMVKGGVDRSNLGDDWFPNFFGENIPRVPRYDWIAQGPLHLCATYLYYYVNKDPRAKLARACLDYQRMKTAHFKTTLPQSQILSKFEFNKILNSTNLSRKERRELQAGYISDDVLSEIRRTVAALYGQETADNLSPPLSYTNAVAYAGTDETLGRLWRDLNGSKDVFATGIVLEPTLIEKDYSLHPDVRPEDAAPYLFTLPWWRALFDCYDEVVLYGSFAAIGLLTGVKYSAYEHGNIRAIPFEDNALGRLTKLAFENADNVFITNTDYVIAKPRLEFAEEKKHYIPHAFEEEIIFDFKAKVNFKKSKKTAKFFFPARQDWVKEDPSLNKGNDLVFKAARKLIDDGLTNFEITCVDWGRDAEKSRELVKDLGLSAFIKWVPPMPKGNLWRAYLNSSCVIDQFYLDAFGGVTYEALALGCRVISRDDGIANKEFFENDPPPILAAKTIDEIAEQMRKIIADPADLVGHGKKATDWILRKHSARQIRDIMQNAFDRNKAAAE